MRVHLAAGRFRRFASPLTVAIAAVCLAFGGGVAAQTATDESALFDLPNPPELRSVDGVLRGTLTFAPAEVTIDGQTLVSEPVREVSIVDQGLASLRMSIWMMARTAMAVVVSIRCSKSLASRRLRPSQAKVRSITQPLLRLQSRRDRGRSAPAGAGAAGGSPWRRAGA